MCKGWVCEKYRALWLNFLKKLRIFYWLKFYSSYFSWVRGLRNFLGEMSLMESLDLLSFLLIFELRTKNAVEMRVLRMILL